MIKQNGFRALLGTLLLLICSQSHAFTIIEIPDSSSSPGSNITESTGFNIELEPLVGTIRHHIVTLRRESNTGLQAASGELFAYNEQAPVQSDSGFIKVSSGSSGSDFTPGVWISHSFTSFDNDFSRTKHDGTQNMFLAGVDFTVNDRYIVGLSASIESSDTDTEFNSGAINTDTYSINPYFAYLISDYWTLDASLGFGEVENEQYRSEGGVNPSPPPLLIANRITSDFSTKRSFFSTNLTYAAPRGNWYLSGWLGYLAAKKDQDDYTESDGTDIEGEDLKVERWNLGGEAAYGHDQSETYLGLILEKDEEVNEIEFATGEQPENDDDSALLMFGWRYFGDDIIANIEVNTRLEADDTSESSLSTTFLFYL